MPEHIEVIRSLVEGMKLAVAALPVGKTWEIDSATAVLEARIEEAEAYLDTQRAHAVNVIG